MIRKVLACLLCVCLFSIVAHASSPLEDDWLFQAGNNPTAERVQEEINSTRQLAGRIAKASKKVDLTAELKQLGRLANIRQQEVYYPAAHTTAGHQRRCYKR